MPLAKRHASFYLIILFLVLSLIDIAREYTSGESPHHLAFEITVCLLAFGWSLFLWVSWLTTKEKLHTEIAENLKLNKEYLDWKTRSTEVVHDLNSTIKKQFTTWELTPSETDVAFLLLKGLPFKEIAIARGGSEKTIRHHALKIYQKSGLQGRNELFAFFFEDLLNQPT
jgi:DNA-binding CsgD family transcriptional regulator